MRHIIIGVFLLFLLPLSLQAQSEIGQKFISGAISLSNNNEFADEYQGIYGRSSIGYLFSNRFAVGISLGYSYSIFDRLLPPVGTIEIKEQTKVNNFGIAPFVGWFTAVTTKITFNLIASAGYGTGHSKVTSLRSRSTGKSTDVYINIAPSFYYLLSEKWAIGTSFGYLRYSKTKSTLSSTGITNNSNVLNFTIWDRIGFRCRYIW